MFLELLPHALETGSAERVMLTVLAGLLAFFALEKLVLWRHAHGHAEHEDDADESEHEHALHAHGTDQGRSGLMILIGTSVHNFCDGVVIAAAFLASPALGVATTVAIVAHAVPQQVGDFAVLVHSGFARSRAFAYNVGVGIATLVGALGGYVALADLQQALPTALAIAASSLLYVAVADLIPSLHRRPEPHRDGEAAAVDRARDCRDRARACGTRTLMAETPRGRREMNCPRARRVRLRRIPLCGTSLRLSCGLRPVFAAARGAHSALRAAGRALRDDLDHDRSIEPRVTRAE